MNVGAVGAVASGRGAVYAALSPYLNGVRRVSDAVAAQQLKIAAASTTEAAVPARASETSIAAAAPPFLNPAIIDISARAALAPAVAVSAASRSISPTDAVLYGDSGLLIQSYGAVALLTAVLAFARVYDRSPAPAI